MTNIFSHDPAYGGKRDIIDRLVEITEPPSDVPTCFHDRAMFSEGLVYSLGLPPDAWEAMSPDTAGYICFRIAARVVERAFRTGTLDDLPQDILAEELQLPYDVLASYRETLELRAQNADAQNAAGD
jgi:hypothetical protein